MAIKMIVFRFSIQTKEKACKIVNMDDSKGIQMASSIIIRSDFSDGYSALELQHAEVFRAHGKRNLCGTATTYLGVGFEGRL